MRSILLLRRLFDLKSHNVLLTRDGTGKIADVGLAKVLTQVRRPSLLRQHISWSNAIALPTNASCPMIDFANLTVPRQLYKRQSKGQHGSNLICERMLHAHILSCLQGYVSKLEEVAGTFAWAAPELLMGGRCSEKVDIFSYGVVLWELATCERPQRGAMRDVR